MTIRIRDADFTVLLHGSDGQYVCDLARPIVAGGVDVWKCALRSAHIPLTFNNMPGGIMHYRKDAASPWLAAEVKPARALDKTSITYNLFKDAIFKAEVKVSELRGDRLAFTLPSAESKLMFDSARLADFLGLKAGDVYKRQAVTAPIDPYHGFRTLRLAIDCIYGSIIGKDIQDVLALIPITASDESIAFIQYTPPMAEWHVSDSVRIQRITYQLRDQFNEIVSFVEGSAPLEFQLQFKLYSVGA